MIYHLSLILFIVFIVPHRKEQTEQMTKTFYPNSIIHKDHNQPQLICMRICLTVFFYYTPTLLNNICLNLTYDYKIVLR